MLHVSNLSFQYQSYVPVVSDLTFSVPDGMVVGLLGKNGAGKTTTLKLILGLLPMLSGTITLDVYSLEKHPLAYKMKIGYVSDNHEIYGNLTGIEYLNFIADMYEVPTNTRKQIYGPLVKAFQVEEYLPRTIKKLSHGTKQKIAIIASLVNDPQLWVLDEPMTGLDVEAVQVLKNLIKSRAYDGKSVLFSSHILELCEKLCDDVIILHHGSIKRVLTLHDCTLNTSLEDLYLEVIGNESLDKDISIK